MKNDGGPAFPLMDWQVRLNDGVTVHGGMTLRDYFIAHAPAKEIEDIVPADIEGCAAFIGIDASEYRGAEHYILVLAVARGMWADAMLAERSK